MKSDKVLLDVPCSGLGVLSKALHHAVNSLFFVVYFSFVLPFFLFFSFFYSCLFSFFFFFGGVGGNGGRRGRQEGVLLYYSFKIFKKYLMFGI